MHIHIHNNSSIICAYVACIAVFVVLVVAVALEIALQIVRCSTPHPSNIFITLLPFHVYCLRF